ncbi:MAG: SDR family oxidoreductase [Ignavibacteria bacterium]|nr:SDR family oxidoreductase [Ignavibacteria bacterium]
MTGANGLLGQAVVTIFSRESDFELIPTSVEPELFMDRNNSFNYEQLDITVKENVKKIVKKHNPDIIVNCAAFTDVDKSEFERELCWKLNVDAVKNLIIASRISDAKVIHISTDYIFDGKNGPYMEDAVPNPISFYGRSKLAGENALTTSGIDFVIVRTIVLYGVGIKVKPNFATWLINKLSAKNPVNIVTDQIGNATISDDLAYGILKCAELDVYGIYNIAGKDIISRLEFTYNLCDVFNFDKLLINPILTSDLKQPAQRPLKSGLITLKAETEFGFKPMDSKEGLQLLKYQMEM